MNTGPAVLDMCWLLVASELWKAYLIPELLGEVTGLVQGETWDQLSGEDMLAAQLINHSRHIEDRVILHQLSVTQTSIQSKAIYNPQNCQSSFQLK